MTKRPIPNLRWYIAILLCLASELNYLDRQTLSVLADTIQRELHLTPLDYSFITSSFLFSYTIMYAVSGRLIDYLGSRRGFMLFVSGWSVVNMIHGLANSKLSLRSTVFCWVRPSRLTSRRCKDGLRMVPDARAGVGDRDLQRWNRCRRRTCRTHRVFYRSKMGMAFCFRLHRRPRLLLGDSLGSFYRLPQEHPRLSAASAN